MKTEEGHGLLTDVDGLGNSTRFSHPLLNRASKVSLRILLLQLLLIASTIINIFCLVLFLMPHTTEPVSEFAHLRRHLEEPYVRITNYASSNASIQDQLWHDINIDHGVVALSDEWAARHNLRTAQRFPWDQTKGIYILHGYHNLHCLKLIHTSLSEFRRGVPQSRSSHHIVHCMDALRRQILCDADDTPRATERRAEVVSGVGQHRTCRSWKDLEEFSKRHTACYKRPEDPEGEGKDIMERFKHCPPGSGYVVTDDYVPTDEIMTGLPEESLENPWE